MRWEEGANSETNLYHLHEVVALKLRVRGVSKDPLHVVEHVEGRLTEGEGGSGGGLEADL